MGCETWREALSARLDGESTEADPATLDAHLAGCPECAVWSTRLDRLHRTVRVAPAGAVPDLTESIPAAVAADRRRLLRFDPSLVLRWVLVVIASIEIGLAAPELSGRWHAGGELGTWAIASAVGLLSVAMKPSRAAAVLPMLAAAGLVTLFVTTRDVVTGHALIAAEWPHLLLVAGVLVMVVLWRREREHEEPGPEVRVSSESGTLRDRARRATRRAA